jgi:hypothetical protein
MGIISEFDLETKTDRDVMAWPQMPAAIPPREMISLQLERADRRPVQSERHLPRRQRVAAVRQPRQDLARREPDLTRNDASKQGPGGAPITNEGAGGEIYGVINYIAESPHDANTLWVGTDDGLVQVTRDGGKSWSNVAPAGVGEAMVNALEVSPHDPATAYVAISKYKFNDFTPLVFKTTDFGKNWTRIVDGIDAEAWTHVVREDPIRRDLLYLGTETGFYISYNGGARWTRFQLNLPNTPITDLKVHRHDLLASTAGRAFWIRTIPRRCGSGTTPRPQPTSPVHAARENHPAVRGEAHRADGGAVSFEGPERHGFALLSLGDAGQVDVEILDQSGAVIRAYSSKRPEADAPPSMQPPTTALTVKAGLNRLTWDVRHDQIVPVPGLYVFGSAQGRLALPGDYRVRLRAGGKTLTESLTVKMDPRVATPLTTCARRTRSR